MFKPVAYIRYSAATYMHTDCETHAKQIYKEDLLVRPFDYLNRLYNRPLFIPGVRWGRQQGVTGRKDTVAGLNNSSWATNSKIKSSISDREKSKKRGDWRYFDAERKKSAESMETTKIRQKHGSRVRNRDGADSYEKMI